MRFDNEAEIERENAKCWLVGGLIIGIVIVIGLAVGLGVALNPSSSNSSNSGTQLPLVVPPTKQSAPSAFTAGFSTQRTKFVAEAIEPQTIIDRFFNPAGGPTNLFGILKDVDSRVSGINGRLGQFSGCMGRTPTPYTLTTWGTNQTFYAQCSEVWGGSGTGFDQWAVVGQTFYLYDYSEAGITAAIVYNFNQTVVDKVHIWYSVGGGPGLRNGSHAVVEVIGLPKQGVFEMSVAGSGVGFCGAQLKSNNATLNITGSQDMGTTCVAVESTCVSAQNIQHTATCTGTVNSFTLRAIGRMRFNVTHQDYGASAYPAGKHGNVYFAATGKDACNFGPSLPTV